jgi:serine/threonine-protein kinase RsbW
VRLKNDLGEIDRCLSALDEFCARFSLSHEIRRAVSVSLDEVLSNIIIHAFPDDDEHLIEVDMAADREHFRATVEDDGIEFDPFAHPHPDTTSDIESRQLGGVGIHLVKALMDHASHRRVDGRNIVILIKRLG